MADIAEVPAAAAVDVVPTVQVESVLAELRAQEDRHQQQLSRSQSEACHATTLDPLLNTNSVTAIAPLTWVQVQTLMGELQSRDAELTRMAAAQRTIKDAYVSATTASQTHLSAARQTRERARGAELEACAAQLSDRLSHADHQLRTANDTVHACLRHSHPTAPRSTSSRRSWRGRRRPRTSRRMTLPRWNTSLSRLHRSALVLHSAAMRAGQPELAGRGLGGHGAA